VSLVGNEQAKLSANYLNGVAIAVLAVGSLGSLLPALGATGPVTDLPFIVGGICCVLSFALHMVARHVLRRLVP
jgi:hypothetical protein